MQPGQVLADDRIAGAAAGVRLPFVVAWLVMGAITFTLRMSFVNLRGFAHAIRVTAGAYDNPDDPGEISHFQALSSALSATVGLGNIAGVAIAIGTGGPFGADASVRIGSTHHDLGEVNITLGSDAEEGI